MTEHLNSEAVSDAMIEAGVKAFKRLHAYVPFERKLRAIYLAMTAARDGPLAEMAAINQAAGLYDNPPVARPVDGLGEQGEVALMAVVDAVRAYLPPDGIDAQECLSRVIGAIDNPAINPMIAAIEANRPPSVDGLGEAEDIGALTCPDCHLTGGHHIKCVRSPYRPPSVDYCGIVEVDPDDFRPAGDEVERVRAAMARTETEGFTPEIEQILMDDLPVILAALTDTTDGNEVAGCFCALRGGLHDEDCPLASRPVDGLGEQGERLADGLVALAAEAHTRHFNSGVLEHEPPRFEDADDCFASLLTEAKRLRAALTDPRPVSEVTEAMQRAGMSYLRRAGSLSMIDLGALWRVMLAASHTEKGEK